MDRPKSAPSNLPRETAIEVRIAEFFVHHANRERTEMDKENLLYGQASADITCCETNVCCCCEGKKPADEEKKTMSGEWIWSWQREGKHGPCPFRSLSRVNIPCSNHFFSQYSVARHDHETASKTCQQITDRKAFKEKRRTLSNSANSYCRMLRQ